MNPPSIDPQQALLKRRRTKIVATVGPASSSPEVLAQLIEAGVDVFRLNMSHGEHAGHAEAFRRIRDAAEAADRHVAVLADLCGPKIRCGRFAGGSIVLEDGAAVTVTMRDVPGGPGLIPSQYAALAGDVKPGDRILLDDGNLELKVFSLDAFMFSLPPIGSEGAYPPADACDFARHCSAIDFWSINDHAEGVTPAHWRETAEAIRECNAVAGDPANPDTVAFLGWEWTQVGTTPGDHYGHKNVVLADTEEGRIPKRPIDAARFVVGRPSPYGLGLMTLLAGGRLHDFARYQAELAEVGSCDPDANVWDLPDDCKESAATPEVLYRKRASGASRRW